MFNVDNIRQLITSHKLVAMVAGTILVSMILVGTALSMYYTSGSYQLDLSRPEYEASRKDIQANSMDHGKFDVQGPVDAASVREFLELYKVREKSVQDAKAFEGDVLSNENLNIDQAL